MNKRPQYIVIIVDTHDQALAINGAFSRDNYDRVDAFPVGYGLCGLQYRGTRPTVVIRAHRLLVTEKELRWERECLLKIGYNDERTKWIGGYVE